MLPKISERHNKNHLTNEESTRISEALSSGENYDDVCSSMHNTISETETLVTSKQNRCSVETGKSPSTFDNAQTLYTSNSVENAVSLLYGKEDLDKYDILILNLANKLAKTPKSDKSFTDLINSTCNLGDTLNLSNILAYSQQNTSYGQLLTSSFYPIFREMGDWNDSSNSLAKEIVLNTVLARRRNMQTIEMRQQNSQNWKDNVSRNDFDDQPSVPVLDFTNGNNTNENQKLNLLCVFTNDPNYEEVSSSFNKMCHDEDIKMILPMTWNIVVASNVLTISDENNQHITIFSRKHLKAKFDYKYSNNLSLGKKLRFYSSMDVTNGLKSRSQSDRMRKLNSPSKNTAITNQAAAPFNWRNNRAVRKSPKQGGEKKIRNDSFLLLREPILLNCIERNKTKQVLLYKTHSVKRENKNNFCKTLEELLDKSVQYKDEPVHLVSEPLKLITRFKREGKRRVLNVENHYTCKHDLTESPIYKKLQQYKNTKVLREAQHKKPIFRILTPKNEHTMQGKDIRKISGESTITTNSSSDLPTNFSTSFTIKNIDMNRYTMEGTYTSEMSTTPVIAIHSCLNLAKNFPNSFSKINVDMDELFGENKSKFHPRRNTTALKHVNVKKVVSSVFRHFFHFYSLLSSNLKSGTVITRSSSNYWLQAAGVATDPCTLRLARDLFTTVAGKKVVLNIFDYIKFLNAFARTRRLIITELVKQMMVCEELSESEFSKVKCKKCTTMKNQGSEPTEIYNEGNYLRLSQSLPNIWSPKVNSNVEKRSCLN